MWNVDVFNNTPTFIISNTQLTVSATYNRRCIKIKEQKIQTTDNNN